MPKPGGPGKAPSTFDPNKKGLKNKCDKNKFIKCKRKGT